MKKKVLFVAFCVAVACTGALIVQSPQLDKIAGNVLLQENVEALTSSEAAISIPCYHDPGSQCTTNVRLTDGSVRSCTFNDVRKSAPYL